VLVGLKIMIIIKICIVPEGHNFRGAGVRQRVSEQRKKRKPGNRGTSLAWTLETVTIYDDLCSLDLGIHEARDLMQAVIVVHAAIGLDWSSIGITSGSTKGSR